MSTKLLMMFLIPNLLCSDEYSSDKELQIIVKEIDEQIAEWVGFDRPAIDIAYECGMGDLQSELLSFHETLVQQGQHFNRAHIDTIRKTMKQQPKLQQFFSCYISKRNTQNQYFKEKRKYKQLNQFIKQFPYAAERTFKKGDKPIDKGFRLGRFFRAFFEHYYLNVLHPAETASTILLRSITVKTDIFEHEDISECVAVETSGALSESLEDLSIKNIYLKIPEAFDALKHIKLREKCRTEKYFKMIRELTQRIGDINFFNVMYTEHTGYVEIAAEKYGSKQIERIGSIFAHVILNYSHYAKYTGDVFDM